MLYQIFIILVDVKPFGFDQKLFDIWYRNYIEKFQINEQDHYSIQDILFFYLDSIEDDNHICQVLMPYYEEKIKNIIFNTELNTHGYGYRQLIYDSIRDNMFVTFPCHPFETKKDEWVQQNYPTYGGQFRLLKILLLNKDPIEAKYAAHSICLNGIGLFWNHPKGTDFGPGFYFTRNVRDALWTAERRTLSRKSTEEANRPACVVFQCPKDDFDRFSILKLQNNNTIHLNLNRPPIITDDIAEDVMFEWANFVHLCHHYRYPLPLVKEYDGIEGYVCKNIREVQDNINAPICNLQSWQLCIRSFGFAEKFTSWITGIILLQVPDSSSISSTTTLSHQK